MQRDLLCRLALDMPHPQRHESLAIGQMKECVSLLVHAERARLFQIAHNREGEAPAEPRTGKEMMR